MENNHLFAKKFAWRLVSFCKNDGPKPKFFFGKKGELNTPLIIIYTILFFMFSLMSERKKKTI